MGRPSQSQACFLLNLPDECLVEKFTALNTSSRDGPDLFSSTLFLHEHDRVVAAQQSGHDLDAGTDNRGEGRGGFDIRHCYSSSLRRQ